MLVVILWIFDCSGGMYGALSWDHWKPTAPVSFFLVEHTFWANLAKIAQNTTQWSQRHKQTRSVSWSFIIFVKFHDWNNFPIHLSYTLSLGCLWVKLKPCCLYKLLYIKFLCIRILIPLISLQCITWNRYRYMGKRKYREGWTTTHQCLVNQNVHKLPTVVM